MTFDLLTDSVGAVVVKISGDLGMNTVPKLEAAVAPMIRGSSTWLVLDASALEFADSSAIALWVRWANLVQRMEIREPSPFLRRVLARMGLAHKLGVGP